MIEANKCQESEIDLIEILRFLKGKLLYVILGIVFCAIISLGYEYLVQKISKEVSIENNYKAEAKIFAGLNEEGIGVNVVKDVNHIVLGHEVLDSVISQYSKEIEYDTLVENLEVIIVGERIFQLNYFSSEEETAKEMVRLIVEETISYMRVVAPNTEYAIVDSAVEILQEEEKQSEADFVKRGIIGAFVGAFLVTIILSIIYIFSPGLKSKHEIEQFFKIPVLAEINGQLSVEKNANAIRVLTMLINADELSPKVLGITSCNKQEGKTTIVHAIENECKKIVKKVVFLEYEDINKIEELKKISDLIIVDMPELELNSVALTIAQKCDSLLFVIQKNKTSYKTVRECLRIVRIIGCDVKGVILNGR